ncbi:MAG: isoprenyl transferase [Eubacteriales bacterium]|nr:isoprenyl transferase [Eubacteriales bacterium]
MEKNVEMNIPQSVAIIMDGNGRWATKRGLPRTMGHKEGAKTLEKLIGDAGRLGIKYLTVYAFSTENWKRSEDEVSALMQLFRFYRANLLKLAVANGVKLRFIGDRTRFPEDIIKSVNELEAATKDNSNMEFIVAANYGSRDEIRRAAMKYAEDIKSGKVCNEDLTEDGFADYLDTKGVPDPDLLIRTSGELRLSNYLLWQIAYSEIVVTDVLWPDFNIDELKKCIEIYNGRSRRFGGV